MKRSYRHLKKPSAYLWGRCEGWTKIGRYYAVIVNPERGEVLNEKGNILLRRNANGMWVEPDKEGGMRYDKCAVTHLPVDPWTMSKEGWLEKLIEREERMTKRVHDAQQKRMIGRKTPAAEPLEEQRDLFDDKPGDEMV